MMCRGSHEARRRWRGDAVWFGARVVRRRSSDGRVDPYRRSLGQAVVQQCPGSGARRRFDAVASQRGPALPFPGQRDTIWRNDEDCPPHAASPCGRGARSRKEARADSSRARAEEQAGTAPRPHERRPAPHTRSQSSSESAGPRAGQKRPPLRRGLRVHRVGLGRRRGHGDDRSGPQVRGSTGARGESLRGIRGHRHRTPRQRTRPRRVAHEARPDLPGATLRRQPEPGSASQTDTHPKKRQAPAAVSCGDPRDAGSALPTTASEKFLRFRVSPPLLTWPRATSIYGPTRP